MRQSILACSLLILLIAAIGVVATGPATGAQDVLPTPRGQLGGPMPLPPQDQPGQLPSPTPAATPMPLPATPESGVPHPAGCRVAVRPIEELIVLAQSDTPPAPPSDDGGVPADAATTDGVSVTIHELVVCLNAGDHLRATALLTDDYLARTLVETGWEPDEVMSIFGPLLPRAPERWIILKDVTDVQALPDGRAAATVMLFDPERFALGATTSYRIVFRQDTGRWLIDAIVSH